jgi:hypothetical protein
LSALRRPGSNPAGRSILESVSLPTSPVLQPQIAFVEGRSNVMVEYPGTGDGVVSLVGAHMVGRWGCCGGRGLGGPQADCAGSGTGWHSGISFYG